MTRRERTRHLIELGSLVAKAGLVELASDDRAVLLGAFLAVADGLAGEDRERAIELWGRRGRRALGAEAMRPKRADFRRPLSLSARR